MSQNELKQLIPELNPKGKEPLISKRKVTHKWEKMLSLATNRCNKERKAYLLEQVTCGCDAPGVANRLANIHGADLSWFSRLMLELKAELAIKIGYSPCYDIDEVWNRFKCALIKRQPVDPIDFVRQIKLKFFRENYTFGGPQLYYKFEDLIDDLYIPSEPPTLVRQSGVYNPPPPPIASTLHVLSSE